MGSGHTVHAMRTRRATVRRVTDKPVLDVPQEGEIRDELHRLVLADLHGPLGGDDEEFSGENPIDRYPLGRLAPRGVCWNRPPLPSG